MTPMEMKSSRERLQMLYDVLHSVDSNMDRQWRTPMKWDSSQYITLEMLLMWMGGEIDYNWSKVYQKCNYLWEELKKDGFR